MRARSAASAILLAGLVMTSHAWAADAISTDMNGWHTWRIEASGTVNTWCCSSSRGSGETGIGCNLDARSIRLSDKGNGKSGCAAAAGEAQIYVRIDQGEPEVIRVLSSACPVTVDTKMMDHGAVTIEQNIAWFRTVIENPALEIAIRQEALFALVQTETDAAFEYIDTLLAVK